MIFSTVNILFLRWMVVLAVLFFVESIRLKKFPREKLNFFMTSIVYLFENFKLDATDLREIFITLSLSAFANYLESISNLVDLMNDSENLSGWAIFWNVSWSILWKRRYETFIFLQELSIDLHIIDCWFFKFLTLVYHYSVPDVFFILPPLADMFHMTFPNLIFSAKLYIMMPRAIFELILSHVNDQRNI